MAQYTSEYIATLLRPSVFVSLAKQAKIPRSIVNQVYNLLEEAYIPKLTRSDNNTLILHLRYAALLKLNHYTTKFADKYPLLQTLQQQSATFIYVIANARNQQELTEKLARRSQLLPYKPEYITPPPPEGPVAECQADILERDQLREQYGKESIQAKECETRLHAKISRYFQTGFPNQQKKKPPINQREEKKRAQSRKMHDKRLTKRKAKQEALKEKSQQDLVSTTQKKPLTFSRLFYVNLMIAYQLEHLINRGTIRLIRFSDQRYDLDNRIPRFHGKALEDRRIIPYGPIGGFVQLTTNNSGELALKKFDTRGYNAHGYRNEALLSVTPDGDFLVEQTQNNVTCHSNISQDKPVFFAGTIKVISGKLLLLTNYTGHFQHDELALRLTVRYLYQLGIIGSQHTNLKVLSVFSYNSFRIQLRLSSLAREHNPYYAFWIRCDQLKRHYNNRRRFTTQTEFDRVLEELKSVPSDGSSGKYWQEYSDVWTLLMTYVTERDYQHQEFFNYTMKMVTKMLNCLPLNIPAFIEGQTHPELYPVYKEQKTDAHRVASGQLFFKTALPAITSPLEGIRRDMDPPALQQIINPKEELTRLKAEHLERLEGIDSDVINPERQELIINLRKDVNTLIRNLTDDVSNSMMWGYRNNHLSDRFCDLLFQEHTEYLSDLYATPARQGYQLFFGPLYIARTNKNHRLPAYVPRTDHFGKSDQPISEDEQPLFNRN